MGFKTGLCCFARQTPGFFYALRSHAGDPISLLPMTSMSLALRVMLRIPTPFPTAFVVQRNRGKKHAPRGRPFGQTLT